MNNLTSLSISHVVGIVTPSDTAYQAALKMTTHKVGSVLVMDGSELLGIFTERDLMNRVVAMGRDYRTTTVREVMTMNIKCVAEDETITDCYRIMKSNSCRHLPVVGRDDKIMGVVSIRDLLDSLVKTMEYENKVLKEYIAS